MKKITSLTDEQKAKFPQYVEEWLGHGLCAQPADRPNAETAIRMMYTGAGLRKPKIVWADSPLSGALAVHALKNKASVRASVRDSVGASVGASVRASVRHSVGGQHEAGWLAFYRYFRDECGLVDETRALGGLWLLSKSCGWIYPYGETCIATERPTTCTVDNNGLIHSETGPAIAYPDGFQVHAWHGVRVPPKWINSPQDVAPSEILSEQNVEKRAAGIAIIGMEKMLDSLDHKIVDSDPDPERGDLIEIKLDGFPRPGFYLRALCPRNGRIMEAVNDQEMDEMTVRGAQAWRLGIPASEFTYPERRT